MNIYLKETKELEKLKRDLGKKRPKYYVIYLIVIICLAFIIDELATNVNLFVEDYVISNYFGNNLNSYTIAMTLCSAVSVFSFLYKALADKYGRKPFLIINTLGMGAGMFICFLCRNVVGYIFGMLLIYFFVPCDIQNVYIVETASEKRRGLWMSTCKAVAVASLAIIPALLSWASAKNWQNIFLIPACIGLGVGLIALLFVKESVPFMQNRIDHIESIRRQRTLRLTKEEIKAKKVMSSQGGIIAAFKYIIINKHLIWLFVVGVVFSLCSLAAANYSIILQDAVHPMTEEQYNLCLIIYPFVCAGCEVIIGIVSDKLGRKKATVTAGTFAIIGLLYFITAVNCSWYAQITGVFLGIFMAGFASGVDTFNLMCAEQSPTSLRSSVMSIMSVSLSVGNFLGTGILLIVNAISHDQANVGYVAMCVICPTLFIGLMILLSKMPETNKTNLLTVEANVLKEVRKKVRIKVKKDTGVEQLTLFDFNQETNEVVETKQPETPLNEKEKLTTKDDETSNDNEDNHFDI